MNLDYTTYPQILAEYLLIEQIIALLLVITIFSFFSVMASFIANTLEINFWEHTIATQYPIIAQGITYAITLFRMISFAFITVNISRFLFDDMEVLLLTVVAQSLVWMAVIYIITEIILVLTYGPYREPKSSLSGR